MRRTFAFVVVLVLAGCGAPHTFTVAPTTSAINAHPLPGEAIVPGYGVPGDPDLAVIGQMFGGGEYRGHNVAGGADVYAAAGKPTSWETVFNLTTLPHGTPLAVKVSDIGLVGTAVVTEQL